jgi:hypothetical protein
VLAATELVRVTNHVDAGNPWGFEGYWYSNGDGVSCGDTDPCTDHGCCMHGRTRKDPTFKAWGCQVGLELHGSTGAWAHEKLPYAGPAKGFELQVEGTTEGLPLRIAFSQQAYPIGRVSPTIDNLHPGRLRVRFDDAAYPDWCASSDLCDGPPGQRAQPSTSYDFNLQVAGGLADADFDICITSITPFE